MLRKILLSVVPLMATSVLLLASCGDDDGADVTGSESGSPSASGSEAAAEGECVVVDGVDAEADGEIHASLTEYAIDVTEDGAEAGVITFEATNDGSVDHELVVLAATADEIEVDDAGAPVEVGFVGEIEGFASGGECEGSFELTAGTYTLLCAIVEESGESHFSEGMVTELTVS
jgi:hypothetical protein